MFNPAYDKPGLLAGALEFLLGLLFFPTICYICQTFLRSTQRGQDYCQKHKITNNGIHDISNKITSSTFAVCACSIGWLVNSQCTGDIMTDRFYILDNYLIFGVSYFFYDCVSMYLVYSTLTKDRVTISKREIQQFLSDRPLILFHHVLVPVIGFPAMMYFRDGYGDCLLGSSFLIEASTPFVSARVILVHLNMKESLAYVVNGFLMLISFFLCRVMIFPALYWWYATVFDISIMAAITSTPAWVHLATLGLWSPQLIWFHKMLKGSLKVIKDRQKRLSNSTDHSESHADLVSNVSPQNKKLD